MASSIPTVTLRGGKQLPVMAFGVGTALFNQDCTRSVEQALSSGFRFIDTAEVYKNSQHVGAVLGKQSNLKGKVSVLGKLINAKEIRKSALEEREKLQVERFDVLLLHFPPRGVDGNPSNVEAWKAMEQLKDEGVCDVIGVSNWLASDLQEVLDSKPKHPVEVNQVEYHPQLAATDKFKALLQLQSKEKIVSMIYGSLAPLTKDKSHDSPLHAVLNDVASREPGWTPATVLQKWASQAAASAQADAIIASTSNKEDRLREYLATFTSRKLTSEEIEEITRAGGKSSPVKHYMAKYF